MILMKFAMMETMSVATVVLKDVSKLKNLGNVLLSGLAYCIVVMDYLKETIPRSVKQTESQSKSAMMATILMEMVVQESVRLNLAGNAKTFIKASYLKFQASSQNVPRS